MVDIFIASTVFLLIVVVLAIRKIKDLKRRLSHIGEIAEHQISLYTQARSDIARLKEEHRKELWDQSLYNSKREDSFRKKINDLKRLVK